MEKKQVGILGATGAVGQLLCHLLEDHPWFSISFLAGSPKSNYKTFEEALRPNKQIYPISSKTLSRSLNRIEDIKEAQNACELVFSAVDSAVAKTIEPLYAESEIPVISISSAFRQDPAIPILIPEINFQHLEIIPYQQKKKNWKKGFIVCKPNCSIQSYTIPLLLIDLLYKVKKVRLTSMQSVSGAGLNGLSAIQISDNIIPHIPGENEKTAHEPLKVWGSLDKEGISLKNDIDIQAHCVRVPTSNGHMASVFFSTREIFSLAEINHVLQSYQAPEMLSGCPSYLKFPMKQYTDPYFPQLKQELLMQNGMQISIGPLQILDEKEGHFISLSHNMYRGAAGGAIYIAETLTTLKYI